MNDLHYSDEKNILLMVALLKAHNVRRVIASPGTTNITFIGSLMHDPFFEIYSSVDERSAAYIACGMAEESGEPVVLSCTGATASRNYFPGLTEAYYRKLPVLAITSTREECKIGHLIDQQIDRTQIPKDACVCSEHLQVIKDDEDLWNCTIKINRAILALRQHGGGPAHINLPTTYSKNFSVLRLPKVRKISRYYPFDKLPEITQKKIAVFIADNPNLPEDGIPYWDFDAPDIPDALRDASAGAIMASAFLELSTLDKSGDSGRWRALAEKQLRSLASPAYLAEPGTNGGFILKHSVGHLGKGSEVDVPLSYADYYFLEALGRLEKLL